MSNKLKNVVQQHAHVMFRVSVAGNIERPLEQYFKRYTSVKQKTIVSKKGSS